MNKPSALATIHFDDAPLASNVPPVQMHFDEVVTSITFDSVAVSSYVSPAPLVLSESKTHLLSTDGWTWQQLRDYVVDAITSRTGAFPRNPMKEASIFKAFVNRWGDKSETIARQAVEVHQCWWRSAPLSVERFCVGSDPYFAEVLAASV